MDRTAAHAKRGWVIGDNEARRETRTSKFRDCLWECFNSLPLAVTLQLCPYIFNVFQLLSRKVLCQQRNNGRQHFLTAI